MRCRGEIVVVLNYHFTIIQLVLFYCSQELSFTRRQQRFLREWFGLVSMRKKILFFLKILFSLNLLGMLSVTVMATVDQSIFEAVGNIWPNWWFKATLVDAYLGFLTFFVWVAYKERRLRNKVLWFALIMCLGNLAISTYMLLELYKIQVGDTFETLLTRRNG